MVVITTLLLVATSMPADPPQRQWGGPHSGSTAIQFELVSDADRFSEAWAAVHAGSLEGLPSIDFATKRA